LLAAEVLARDDWREDDLLVLLEVAAFSTFSMVLVMNTYSNSHVRYFAVLHLTSAPLWRVGCFFVGRMEYCSLVWLLLLFRIFGLMSEWML
jgi:hypothetical protein